MYPLETFYLIAQTRPHTHTHTHILLTYVIRVSHLATTTQIKRGENRTDRVHAFTKIGAQLLLQFYIKCVCACEGKIRENRGTRKEIDNP